MRNLWMNISAFALLAAVLSCAEVSGQSGLTAYVNANGGLILRAAPGQTGARVDLLPFGTELAVQKRTGAKVTLGGGLTGEWIAVETKSTPAKKGYVFDSFVQYGNRPVHLNSKVTDFEELSPGILYDRVRKKSWTRCPLNKHGQPTCKGCNTFPTLRQAESLCAALKLGGKRWRVPTVPDFFDLVTCPEAKLDRATWGWCPGVPEYRFQSDKAMGECGNHAWTTTSAGRRDYGINDVYDGVYVFLGSFATAVPANPTGSFGTYQVYCVSNQ